MYATDKKFKAYVIALIVCLAVIIIAVYHDLVNNIIPIIILSLIVIFYALNIARHNGYQDITGTYLFSILLLLIILVIIKSQSISVGLIIAFIVLAFFLLTLMHNINLREDRLLLSLLVVSVSLLLLAMIGRLNVVSAAVGVVYLAGIMYISYRSGWYDMVLLTVPLVIETYALTHTIGLVTY